MIRVVHLPDAAWPTEECRRYAEHLLRAECVAAQGEYCPVAVMELSKLPSLRLARRTDPALGRMLIVEHA